MCLFLIFSMLSKMACLQRGGIFIFKFLYLNWVSLAQSSPNTVKEKGALTVLRGQDKLSEL